MSVIKKVIDLLLNRESGKEILLAVIRWLMIKSFNKIPFINHPSSPPQLKSILPVTWLKNVSAI